MEKTPESIGHGTFRLFGVDVHCHVLDDGRRVLDAESVDRLFTAMADAPPSSDVDDATMAEFARWIRGATP